MSDKRDDIRGLAVVVDEAARKAREIPQLTASSN
jgi:hypothetical protein